MSVSEAKESVPVTEALRWSEYIWEREWGSPSKTDLYLARICYQLYLLFFLLGGKPDKTIKDFIYEFPRPDKKDEQATPELTYEEEVAQAEKLSAESRAAWMAAAGVMGKKIAKEIKKTDTKPKQPKVTPVVKLPDTPKRKHKPRGGR